MKKAVISMIVAALIFSAGLIGFYIGRGQSTDPVIVSKHPGQVSTVPTGTAASTEQTEPAGPVNINTATVEELDSLPGIGPVLAQRIIDYREENGPFETISELTMVSGIGISTLEELMDYITVGG